MKLNRTLAFVVALLLAVASFAACSAQPTANNAAAPEWKITIAGADKAEFTSVDYDKLTKVTIDAVQKKKDGSEQQQKWEGVLLKDVLNSLGITSYTSITLSASDDYSKDYTPEIANDPKTIIGTVMNGKALGKDGGFVEAVAASQAGNMWIKNLAKITVNK
jgi:hypothetical protein